MTMNSNHTLFVLRDHFKIYGQVQIDPQTQVVNVDGNVTLKSHFPARKVKKLPVQFGKVTGKFDCYDNELETLMGAPHHVGENFDVSANKITSMAHAPIHVGGRLFCYYNNLTDLAHMPQHVIKVHLSYHDNLPMLRLSEHDNWEVKWTPLPVQEILNKYMGKGKKFMLNFANELKQAGFAGNARW
jgi:hypothetical protein